MAEPIVTLTGPLFEGRISANIRGGFRTGMQRIGEAEREAGRKQLGLRSRFRTAKYGHAADSLRTKVTRVGGDEYEVASYIGGQAMFLGPILEKGTVAHFIGAKRQRIRVPALGRRAYVEGKFKPLSISVGGRILYRQYAHHPGTPAYRWAEQATAEVARLAPGILKQALAEQVNA